MRRERNDECPMSQCGFPSHEETRRRRIADQRAAACRALRLAEDRVRAAGGRLVVFGSLAEGGFHERSDIDVAILGLPAGPDSELAAEIDTLPTLAGFTAEVVAERFLSPSLRQRVSDRGREPGALG